MWSTNSNVISLIYLQFKKLKHILKLRMLSKCWKDVSESPAVAKHVLKLRMNKPNIVNLNEVVTEKNPWIYGRIYYEEDDEDDDHLQFLTLVLETMNKNEFYCVGLHQDEITIDCLFHIDSRFVFTHCKYKRFGIYDHLYLKEIRFLTLSSTKKLLKSVRTKYIRDGDLSYFNVKDNEAKCIWYDPILKRIIESDGYTQNMILPSPNLESIVTNLETGERVTKKLKMILE